MFLILIMNLTIYIIRVDNFTIIITGLSPEFNLFITLLTLNRYLKGSNKARES